MAYGNEETSSTYYFTLLNTLPGVGSSATGKAAEQYGEQGVVVSTKGSSIGRGEIEYILRNDLWGLPKQAQVDKFKQKWPSKNPGKLQQICTAIRGGVKLETNELLGIEFEKYRLGKQSWEPAL